MRDYADLFLVQVRKLRTRKASGALELGAFDGAANLRTVLAQIASRFTNYTNSGVLKRSFKIENLKNDGMRLSGIMRVGETGYESPVIDTRDGREKYKKSKHEIVPAPYYFSFTLPDKEKKGLLCIHSIGLSGIKGILETALIGNFRLNYTDYNIDIANIIPAELLKDLINKGLVEEFRFERHNIPADVADWFGGNSRSYEGSYHVSVKAKDKSLFQKGGILAAIDGQKPLKDVFKIGGFPFDTVKARIDLGGRGRLVDITKPARFMASFDVTDDLTAGPDGYPTEASLKTVFDKISDDIGKKAGMII